MRISEGSGDIRTDGVLVDDGVCSIRGAVDGNSAANTQACRESGDVDTDGMVQMGIDMCVLTSDDIIDLSRMVPVCGKFIGMGRSRSGR